MNSVQIRGHTKPINLGGFQTELSGPSVNPRRMIPYTHSLLICEEETALFSHEYHVRLVLLGFLVHWKNQLPVGGVPVYHQMIKKQVSAIQSIEHCVRLTREW